MRWLLLLGMLAGCVRSPDPTPVAAHTGTPPPTGPEKKGRVVVTDTSVQVLDPIHFDGQSAQITLTSIPMIDAIASTLNGNPSIKLVEIHAFGPDNVPAYQQFVGQQRAQAIVQALVDRKVDPKRLRAHGEAIPPSGDPRPVFEIIERAP